VRRRLPRLEPPTSYSQTDLVAPPTGCTALHARARSLLLSALDHLGVAHDR
jgi:hypothetical protein